MELTKRFHKFLSDANSQSDNISLRSDLFEELTKVKELLLKFPTEVKVYTNNASS